MTLETPASPAPAPTYLQLPSLAVALPPYYIPKRNAEITSNLNTSPPPTLLSTSSQATKPSVTNDNVRPLILRYFAVDAFA